MSRRLFLFFGIGFLVLNGCLYSCNPMPEKTLYQSTDFCDASGGSRLVQFRDTTGDGNRPGNIYISMVMLLPCKGDGNSSEVFSLAFYDVNNFSEPADLENLTGTGWNFSNINKCDISSNAASVTKIEGNSDLKALSLGSAISLAVGHTYSNRLYPFGIKIPYTNWYDSGSGCGPGDVDMSPFTPTTGSYSPIYQNGKEILSEQNRIQGTYSIQDYSNKPIPIGAPFFTMGTKIQPEGSNEGLKSIAGQVSSGSLFQFDVHIKPGQYYVVLSKVSNPMAAMSGTFSLKDVKVFSKGATNNYKDYSSADCGGTVKCGTPITVS